MPRISGVEKRHVELEVSLDELRSSFRKESTTFTALQDAYLVWKDTTCKMQSGATINKHGVWEIYVNRGSHYSGDEDIRKATDEEIAVNEQFKNLLKIFGDQNHE